MRVYRAPEGDHWILGVHGEHHVYLTWRGAMDAVPWFAYLLEAGVLNEPWMFTASGVVPSVPPSPQRTPSLPEVLARTRARKAAIHGGTS